MITETVTSDGRQRFKTVCRAFAAFFKFAFILLITALTVVKLLTFPSKPGPSLDNSWAQVLVFANSHSLAFGRDILFTFGPLGFLQSPVFDPGSGNRQIILECVMMLLICVPLIQLGLRLSASLRVVLVLFLWWSPGLSYWIPSFALLAAIVEQITAEKTSPWKVGFLAAFSAILSLTKFTLLFSAFAGLFAAACELWIVKRKRWHAVGLLAGYAVLLALLWSLLSQRLKDLPQYLECGFQISSGYTGAMAIYEAEAIFNYGILLACVGLFWWGSLFILSRRNRSLWFAYAVILLFGYFAWKHGFVRADSHVLDFFSFIQFLALVFAVLERYCKPAYPSFSPVIRVVAFFIAGVAIIQAYPPKGIDLWAASNEWRWKISKLVNYRQNLANAAKEYTEAEEEARLPKIASIVRNSTVDQMGHLQTYTILNRFNYRPRFVFQSYSTYTHRLAELNAKHFTGSEAPKFVLVGLEDAFDRRIPLLGDNLAWLQILADYRYTAEEQGFVLLDRKPEANQEQSGGNLLRSGKLKFGHHLDLSEFGGRGIWLKLKLRPTLYGRLRALLYKPPYIEIEVADKTLGRQTYRIDPVFISEGFLVSPVIQSNYDVAQLLRARLGKEADFIRIKMNPRYANCYSDRIEYEVSERPAIRFDPISLAGLFAKGEISPDVLQAPDGNSAGLVDSYLDFQGEWYVTGWARVPDSQRPADVVLAAEPQTGGLLKFVGIADERSRRSELAKSLGEPGIEWSGWRMHFSDTIDLKSVVFIGFDADRKRFYKISR